MNIQEHLSNDQLLSVLAATESAVAVHIFEDATIAFANKAMLKIWDKDERVIGKTLEEALPELKGQPFIAMFKRVWNEGIVISGKDTAAHLIVDGTLQTFYFDFEYRAMLDSSGKTFCILHTATDVTDKHLGRQREQNLTEELMAANEELSAANEALYAINDELTRSQAALRQLNQELEESDRRFRSMVEQAPVGLCIIRAEDLYIQEVNNAYLELVGKGRHEFEARTIWEAVPETAGVYAPVMDQVIGTGKAFYAKEHEVMLIRHGMPETVYLDFVYEPIKQQEKVAFIMVLVIDVTDKVIARHRIEEMEERVRMAVEAAEMGTFDADLTGGNVLASEKFYAIMDLAPGVKWEQILAVIHPDDMHIRNAAIEAAFKDGKLLYDVRIIHQDGSLRWIRVHGYIYYNSQDEPARVLGTVQDITAFKHLEQQKDDFISIASHELKTPVTSLKASLQLLDRMKEKPTPLMPKLIGQSAKSIARISALVNDLLNVSRANEKGIKLNKARFNLKDILDICRSHIKIAGPYNLIVEGDQNIELYADERAIEQVLINFINNAIKYAPASMDVLVQIEQTADLTKITVRDEGPGIAAEKLPYLFERYYQGEASGFNNSGLGLGLYISSDIIKRHGGQIGVESEEGKGSNFWFTLPADLG